MRTIRHAAWASQDLWGGEGLMRCNEEGVVVGLIRSPEGADLWPPRPLSDAEITRLLTLRDTEEWTELEEPEPAPRPEEAAGKEEELPELPELPEPPEPPELTPLEEAIAATYTRQLADHLAALRVDLPPEPPPPPVRPAKGKSTFLKRPIEEVLADLPAVTDPPFLQELVDYETQRKNRPAVLEALADRLLDLVK